MTDCTCCRLNSAAAVGIGAGLLAGHIAVDCGASGDAPLWITLAAFVLGAWWRLCRKNTGKNHSPK